MRCPFFVRTHTLRAAARWASRTKPIGLWDSACRAAPLLCCGQARSMSMAALETIEAESGPHPTATIIILHGLGADGSDFVPIAQELDLDALGPVRFIFPHAPVMPVTI